VRDEQDARGAAAAGVLGGDEATYRGLLQSIVDVARAIFGAEAASIFLYDEEADELVFEAVSGQGGDTLVGARFPSSTGIAGFALVTRQPLVVDDLENDPRFSRDRAASTGFVPTSIVSSPLLHDERALGVLSVLDRDPSRPFGVAELDLLSRFSSQAAIGLDLLLSARRARSALDGEGTASVVARVAALLADGDDEAGRALLEALERVLSSRRA
jgi:GAF domain-containing protein